MSPIGQDAQKGVLRQEWGEIRHSAATNEDIFSTQYILKKQYPKTHPTENEIETWLKRQEVHHISAYCVTRKGGSSNDRFSDRFYPTKPRANISIDLIDVSKTVGPAT